MRSFLLGTILVLFVVGCDVGRRDVNTPLSSTTYAISGSVSGANATGFMVALTGAAVASTSTDGNGNYSFGGLANGVYTLTPSKSGYSFSPPSITVTMSNADVTGQNFTATAAASQSQLTILAGVPSGFGNLDGVGSNARFRYPESVAVDGSGNIYVADAGNNTIRKVTPAGVVSTLAGTAGQPPGSADGTGADVRFESPSGVAVDGSANLYVADTLNNTIRKITPAGMVSTLAGKASQSGSADGTGADARFNFPYDVAVDGAGNVYVADYGNNTIRKVTPAGVVSTLAGTAGQSGSADGTGAAARFYSPQGVAVDGSGNIYVADDGNKTIRKVTPAGVVSTLAGTAGQPPDSVDGTGAAARFYSPQGVAVDESGNVYVADTYNNTIRKVTPAGVVSTLAGTAVQSGSADGTGAAARFYSPQGVAVDEPGNVYVADTFNNTIRGVTPAGVVSTLAGTAGLSGSADGTGAAARFDHPSGVAVDGSRNVYVADFWNNTIRKVTPEGMVSTLAGTAGEVGSADGTGAAARFNFPIGVAVDVSGNIYVAELWNNTIRTITPTGVVSTLAGAAGQPTDNVDGMGAAARFNFPSGVTVDGTGNVYVADFWNNTIRKVTPTGVVTTVVGVPGRSGTLPGPLPASLNAPWGVAVEPTTGDLFIVADAAVLKVNL